MKTVKDIGAEATENMLIDLIYATTNLLNGKINVNIPCEKIYLSDKKMVLDLGIKEESMIYGSSLIQSIILKPDYMLEWLWFNNASIKDVRSMAITITAHELAHLDQDTNRFHYDEKEAFLYYLYYEIPNVIFTAGFLNVHKDMIKKELGAFDPFFDVKNSSYLYDKELAIEIGQEKRKIQTNISEAIVNFIEPGLLVDMTKVIDRYEAIYFDFADFNNYIYHGICVPCEAFKDYDTPKNKHILGNLIKFLECICTSYEMTVTVMNNKEDRRTLEIDFSLNKLSKYISPIKTIATNCYFEDEDLIVEAAK